jgi:tetratricopeptide (TPR) repeat protein
MAHLGLAFYGDRKVDKAIATLQRAIALDPRCADAHFFLGQVYLSEKRYDEAAGPLQTAIELDPKLTPARQSLMAAWAGRRSKGGACGCLGAGPPSGPTDAALGAMLPVALLLAPHAMRLARRRRKRRARTMALGPLPLRVGACPRIHAR